MSAYILNIIHLCIDDNHSYCTSAFTYHIHNTHTLRYTHTHTHTRSRERRRNGTGLDRDRPLQLCHDHYYRATTSIITTTAVTSTYLPLENSETVKLLLADEPRSPYNRSTKRSFEDVARTFTSIIIRLSITRFFHTTEVTSIFPAVRLWIYTDTY